MSEKRQNPTAEHEQVEHGQHDHGHPHDHGDRDRDRGEVLHSIKSLLGLHSHDPSDSVDDALEASERGIHALKISFVALMVTAVAQAAIVYFTGSVALLAD